MPNLQPISRCLISVSNKDNIIELAQYLEDQNIEIISKRTGKIFGIHKIIFYKGTNRIEFMHESKSRNIYSDGALQAAHWIKAKKKGLYSFEDFMKSSNSL